MDSGSVFLKPVNKEKSAVALTSSKAIVACYNVMHYDAINITTHDLQLGADFLKQLEQEATFPFLSATILDSKTNTPLFTPYVILKKNNLNIGIIGLTAQKKTAKGETYVISDWQQPLKNSLNTLADTDLIILLSNLTPQENLRIAKTYPQIHIILEAGQTLNNSQIKLAHNTLISHIPKEGKYIGGLKIDWQESKLWQSDNRLQKTMQNEIDRLLWFKNKISKRGGPEKAYQDNPDALTRYNAKMQQLHLLQTKLSDQQKNEVKTKTASTYQSLLLPLKPTIPDEPQTTQILKLSREKNNKLRRKTGVHKRFDVYMGSASCKPCHASIYTEYKKTPHSKAYATLVQTSDNNNPNCIFCHVTGLPEQLAYLKTTVPKRLLEVGCEICHGPGQQHIKNPKTMHLQRDVTESTCLTCHTTDHSNNFNYGRDVNLVH